MYGNENATTVEGSQFLTIDGTSDTVTLPAKTRAVSLYATTDCWVVIGAKGTTPTAAAPGAEKTSVNSFFLPTGAWFDVGIPMSSDSRLIKIAAIQASAGGVLYVTYRGQL